ncbi:MAG: glycosyl hydrolase family 17, partial [Flavobacteriaceae bacterium]|nr:glycosyl hydrolase family 17 [Flavobacteriaceae bacterium]
MHTYPMHDTHYNPSFWGVLPEETELSEAGKIDAVMKRAVSYAIQQYDSVVAYIRSLGINKAVHIGETGWASHSNGFYGKEGSLATDEYKEALFYWYLHEWAREKNISCFYFEAFDEPWKDSMNPEGSENHFGLFTVDGKAKFVLWDLVDTGTFKGLSRDGQPIAKTYKGDKAKMLLDVYVPPIREAISANH